MVSFLVFQDATDGMAVDIIPINQQARANGLMWGSKIIGISSSLALGWLDFNVWLLLYSCYQLWLYYYACAFTIAGAANWKNSAWTAGIASPETTKMQLSDWVTIFKSLYSVLVYQFLAAPAYLFAKGAYNYIDTLLPIFTS